MCKPHRPPVYRGNTSAGQSLAFPRVSSELGLVLSVLHSNFASRATQLPALLHARNNVFLDIGPSPPLAAMYCVLRTPISTSPPPPPPHTADFARSHTVCSPSTASPVNASRDSISHNNLGKRHPRRQVTVTAPSARKALHPACTKKVSLRPSLFPYDDPPPKARAKKTTTTVAAEGVVPNGLVHALGGKVYEHLARLGHPPLLRTRHVHLNFRGDTLELGTRRCKTTKIKQGK